MSDYPLSPETMLVAQLKELCPVNASVTVGIDDDAAVLNSESRHQLICKDMLMDGVHFKLAEQSPDRIGRKALAVNLSDIAAMGGKALSAYVALAIPRSHAHSEFLAAFYRGMVDLATEFDVAIAGGDTNIWEGPLVVSVTVVGQVHPKGAVLRRGATVGEDIYVTGPLGGSIEGHHLDFQPRLAEVEALMNAYTLTSMIDLSDGLAKDLREIVRQSHCGAEIFAEHLPLRSIHGRNSVQRALADGEDFELCFTVDRKTSLLLEHDPRFPYCKKIGHIIDTSGLYWMRNGRLEAIDSVGYEHGRTAL